MRTASLLLAVLLLVPGFALAGGPLLLAGPNTPYSYAGVTNVYTDLGNCGPTLTNAEADAVTSFSFGEWGAVATSSFNPSVAGDFGSIGLPDITSANAGLVVGTNNGGGIHVIYDNDGLIIQNFFGAPPGVLGIASPDFATGTTLTESWAVMNGTAVDPADAVGTYFAGVFTHEFGHSINLAHTQTNGAIVFFGDDRGPNACGLPYGGSPAFADVETMYPFISPAFGSIGQQMSTIDVQDDISSLSNIYATGGWPTGGFTIDGVTRRPNSNPVGGVNVIARNVADPFGDCNSMLSGSWTQTASDGTYFLNGLTPGANYVVYVDGIVAGGFSQNPASVPPGAEEFFNGGSESADPGTDLRCNSVNVSGAAGGSSTADVTINGPFVVVNDDGFQEVDLPFPFEFCDAVYTSVFVNANGHLTFGAGDSDFSPSVAEFLSGPPRIAGLWADLSPQDGGTLTAQAVGPDFEVRYNQIPEFGTGSVNTFTFVLRPDGTHDVQYGTMQTLSGIAGRTPGGGAPNPGASDLSTEPEPITDDTIYQQFFSNLDLGNSTLEYAACGDTCLVDDPPVSIPFSSIAVLGDSAGCEVDVTASAADSASFDPNGTIVSRVLEPAGPYAEGVNPVDLIVTDECGLSDTTATTITVTCPVGPVLACSPSDTTFATGSVGDTVCVTVTVENTGDQDLVISSITGCDTGDFYLDAPALPDTVPGPGTRTFDVCWVISASSPDSCVTTVTTDAGTCDVVLRTPVVTAVPGDGRVGLALSPVFPNPFRGAAGIRFSLERTGPVTLEVYDLQGRRVRTLARENYGSGTHEVTWDGRTDHGRLTAAGVYVIRLVSGEETRVVRAVRLE